MQKVVRAGNIVVLDEKNRHIRNTRDGTVIRLDVNNGVHTMDMWKGAANEAGICGRGVLRVGSGCKESGRVEPGGGGRAGQGRDDDDVCVFCVFLDCT